MRPKKLMTAVAVAATVGTAVMATAGPAAAAYGVGCNGFLCMQIKSINGNTATIAFWNNANSPEPGPVYGHFELQTPNHHTYNTSPDQSWAVNEVHDFTENGGTGNWCGTFWNYYDGGYQKSGYECVSA